MSKIKSLSETDQFRAIIPVPKDAPKPNFWHSRYDSSELENVYDYRDMQGALLFHTVRFVGKDQKKDVLPYHLSEGADRKSAWVWGKPQTRTSLFGLENLDSNPDKPILIVEGEKTALAARQIYPNYIVLSWLGGADNWKHADWKILINRKITLLPDNDYNGTGQRAMHALGKLLARNNEVIIVNIPGYLPDKWDVADIFPYHLTPNLLLENVRRIWPALYPFTIKELTEHAIIPKPILAPIFMLRSINMVYGARGIGKTWFTTSLAVMMALKRDFLNCHAQILTKVLYIDGEMSASAMGERFKLLGYDDTNLRVLSADMEDGTFIDIAKLEDQAAINQIAHDYNVIVLDNLSCLHRMGEESDGDSWMPVLDWLLYLKRQGKCVIMIHHAGKNGTQRGTSRREDALDVVIMLKQPADYTADQGACFELHYEKARHVKGEQVAPLLGKLVPDSINPDLLTWQWSLLQDEKLEQIVELMEGGMLQKDVATELDISAGQVSKLVKKARKMGRLPEKLLKE